LQGRGNLTARKRNGVKVGLANLDLMCYGSWSLIGFLSASHILRRGRRIDMSERVTTGQIGEQHMVWLLWFVMRNGSEVDPADDEQAWSYEHVGVRVRLAVQSLGNLRVVKAAGRRWTLRLVQSSKGLHLKELSSPKNFWRDLGVMRLCDSDNVPLTYVSPSYVAGRHDERSRATHHPVF